MAWDRQIFGWDSGYWVWDRCISIFSKKPIARPRKKFTEKSGNNYSEICDRYTEVKLTTFLPLLYFRRYTLNPVHFGIGAPKGAPSRFMSLRVRNPSRTKKNKTNANILIFFLICSYLTSRFGLIFYKGLRCIPITIFYLNWAISFYKSSDVIPAKAGIQIVGFTSWIPACTGMTDICHRNSSS